MMGTHWNLKGTPPPLSFSPKLKGKKARQLECMLGASHWLHEISLPKRVRSWPWLILLAKNTIPVEHTF